MTAAQIGLHTSQQCLQTTLNSLITTLAVEHSNEAQEAIKLNIKIGCVILILVILVLLIALIYFIKSNIDLNRDYQIIHINKPASRIKKWIDITTYIAFVINIVLCVINLLGLKP